MTGFAIGSILFILIVLAMSGFFDAVGLIFQALLTLLRLFVAFFILWPLSFLAIPVGLLLKPHQQTKLHAFVDTLFELVLPPEESDLKKAIQEAEETLREIEATKNR